MKRIGLSLLLAGGIAAQTSTESHFAHWQWDSLLGPVVPHGTGVVVDLERSCRVPRFDTLGGQRFLSAVETIWTYELSIDAAWTNQLWRGGGWYLPSSYLGINAIGRLEGMPFTSFAGVSTQAQTTSTVVPLYGTHAVLHSASPPPVTIPSFVSAYDWVGTGTVGLELDVQCYCSNSVPTLMASSGSISVEVRYHFTGPELPWKNLGGSSWVPDGGSVLTATGSYAPSTTMYAELTHSEPLAPSLLALGGSPAWIPLWGGALVMDPLTVATLLVVCDGNGAHSQPIDLPAGMPPGTEFYLQHWTLHPEGTGVLSGSNGIAVIVQ